MICVEIYTLIINEIHVSVTRLLTVICSNIYKVG